MAPAVLLLLLAVGLPMQASAQAGPSLHEATPSGAATFRSGVSLVSVTVVVRDARGRVVPSLTRADFEIIDQGQRHDVLQFHSDTTAPASIALLVDGSGSMALAAARDQALGISTALLGYLTPGRDAAALLSFDTRLLTVCEFTGDFERIRAGFGVIESFGSTSLYDAVAGAAALVADRAQHRRAVIVMTDGADTASAYSPAAVARIASTIDVPVYVFAVGTGASGDEGFQDGHRWEPLAELARATGGDLFPASSPALVAAALTRVTDELRHQYVLAFEPVAGGELRRLQVRTRHKDLRVTARTWYQPPAP
jgi:Ca-activated chloride channel family protein